MTGVVLASVRDLVLLEERVKNLLTSTWSLILEIFEDRGGRREEVGN